MDLRLVTLLLMNLVVSADEQIVGLESGRTYRVVNLEDSEFELDGS